MAAARRRGAPAEEPWGSLARALDPSFPALRGPRQALGLGKEQFYPRRGEGTDPLGPWPPAPTSRGSLGACRASLTTESELLLLI